MTNKENTHRDNDAYRLHDAWRTHIDRSVESIEYLNKADFRAAAAEFSQPYRERITQLEVENEQHRQYMRDEKNAHHRTAIEATNARARIAELEERLAEQDAEHEKLVSAKRRAETRVRAWEERTGETGPSAPRIVGAKLEPVTVDGKTPGQAWDEAYTNALLRAGLVRYADWNTTSQKTREMAEEAALAVVCAFTSPHLTRIAELEAENARLREAATLPSEKELREHYAGDEWGAMDVSYARQTIAFLRERLGKVPPTKAPSSDHAHEIGSCSFCDKDDANDERKP